ncbi:fibronectin type III domain-containing protein [Nocardioides bruguierae]|uniref:Fibronectin type III domain-containing protein n=1 Tax=Nocardioides bruguierae TaxID=2945102 RepID=A0A9X2D6Z3_9ACTN|nr:fibronectin type III domain-containing protein [Nocardioides bruguierae]MCM0620503.1 fibronectin type III domain-containing protein [Nocardioides bruguierae]
MDSPRSLRRPRRARLLALAAATVAASALAAPVAGPLAPARAADEPASDLTVVDADLLPAPARGARAVRLLGEDLGTAAALNDLTGRALAEVLREDPTAWLDPTGRLFYRDELAADRDQASPQATAADLIVPAEDTFTLHSLPGAQRTIFIDFDGGTVSGTAWNAWKLTTTSVLGFSYDADYSTFSTAERALIQQVWQQVAEDFAPFAVDVTTQDPGAAALTRSGSGDQVYGAHAMVTDDLVAHAALCVSSGCTGIAYVDVFDDTSSAYYSPAWAFTGYYDDVETITGTVSHEVGHNLGLSHDGVSGGTAYYGGQGIWGPIMGSTWRPLVQWSKGEYPSPSNTEDDLSLIAANGAPRRTDDVGDTVAAASAAALPASGVIGTPTDVDVFSLGTCTGEVTVSAATAETSPNLDLELQVLDAGGATLATADPASAAGDGVTASGTGAAATVSVVDEPLFARLDGVGNGSWAAGGYGDYGSLGGYTLAVSGCETSSPTAPGTPTDVSATATGTTTATISWAAPASDGGSALTGYVVSLDGADVATVSAGTTSRALTGLSAGTTYTVGVRATNAVGASPVATTGLTTDAGTATVPDAPSDLVLTWDADAGLLLLAFAEPASDGGAPVEAYRVYESGGLIGTVSSGAGGAISGFAPGDVAVIAVTALNNVGESAAASATLVIPRAATTPGRPRIGAASSGRRGGAITAVARWSAPSSDGGAALTGYRVVARKWDAAGRVVQVRRVDVAASATRQALRLTRGRWSFRVQARNTEGLSRPSAASSVVRAR